MTITLRRALAVALTFAVAVFVAACGGSSSNKTSETTPAATEASTTATTAGPAKKVTLLMNWFPQAEHGGYFDAMATGKDKKNGVEFKILSGGPQILTVPQVAAGKADFGVAQADQILQARAQGLPIVEVFAAFQTNPQCLMFHADQPVKDFKALNGRTVAISPDARTSYWAWMVPHFGLTSAKTVTNPGTLSLFKRDDKLVQQCFITSEPFYAKQAKIDIGTLMIADSGYNPYANGLFTTEKMIRENPDLVRSVVTAAHEGWIDLLNDPTAAKQAVIAANKDQDPAQFDYSVKTMKDRGLIGDNPGMMTAERWTELRDQLVTAKALKSSVDASKAFTSEFLPK